ncbi:phage tail protein [Escherichia coli]
MATKYYAVLTNVGAAKLANATALGAQVEITQMAVGDGNGVLPTPNPAQTALVHELRRKPLNSLSIDPNNANQIIAEQVIPEDEGGWWIREIGLFDKDGDMIAVANCAETYKPQLQEGSGRVQVVRMILIVSSTAAVTLKIDPSVVLATRKYVDDQIIQVKSYVDQKMAAHVAAADPHKQYAPKESPALTGRPTAPTAEGKDSSTQIANTAFVQAAIAALVGSSPEALDTLNELAAALGNDPNFATTVTNSLAGKMDKSANGSDIENVSVFLQNLGLPELLNLKRDKTDNRFSTFVFESGRPEDSLWLAYDEQKKQFAIAFKVDGAAKYVYLQNKGGSLALEEQVTAQAILTKLLQVDGSGSGLDADLVRGLPADFGSSPSTNGYQKLPSGMIIQWGMSEVTSTDIYVKFPVAFTRPPLFVGESSPGGGQTTSVWTANAITNVGFNATQICVLSNTSDRVLLPDNNATTWLAIGF